MVLMPSSSVFLLHGVGDGWLLLFYASVLTACLQAVRSEAMSSHNSMPMSVECKSLLHKSLYLRRGHPLGRVPSASWP